MKYLLATKDDETVFGITQLVANNNHMRDVRQWRPSQSPPGHEDIFR